MKSSVFVLVRDSEPGGRLVEVAEGLLDRHRMTNDPRDGRFDYLVEPLERSFSDSTAEFRLRGNQRRSFEGHISRVSAIPANVIPGSLVLPDGTWSDLSDFGWRMVGEKSENENAFVRWKTHYRKMLAEHPDCLALEFCAHS